MAQVSDFTIQDVLAFARSKPADEAYDYSDAENCAVSQFGRATNRPYLIDLFSWDLRAICAPLETAVVSSPQTFGALVFRLEALIPEPVGVGMWLKVEDYIGADPALTQEGQAPTGLVGSRIDRGERVSS